MCCHAVTDPQMQLCSTAMISASNSVDKINNAHSMILNIRYKIDTANEGGMWYITTYIQYNRISGTAKLVAQHR